MNLDTQNTPSMGQMLKDTVKIENKLNAPLISCNLICNFTPTDVLQKESEKFIAPPCKSHLFTPSQLQEKHVPPPHRHLSPNPPMDAELLAEPADFSPSFEANAVRSDFHPTDATFHPTDGWKVGNGSNFCIEMNLGSVCLFVFRMSALRCVKIETILRMAWVSGFFSDYFPNAGNMIPRFPLAFVAFRILK